MKKSTKKKLSSHAKEELSITGVINSDDKINRDIKGTKTIKDDKDDNEWLPFPDDPFDEDDMLPL